MYGLPGSGEFAEVDGIRNSRNSERRGIDVRDLPESVLKHCGWDVRVHPYEGIP